MSLESANGSGEIAKLRNIEVGAWARGGLAEIDVARLVETRMLVQANSGGGKSWALRRILEQTAGKVQQLIVDPEGEFATLRERHDVVIAAAHDGDALAHPKTAKILAERLLETGVSAVLDIYDLKAHERMAFVRTFFDALTNARKALWRPVLVVLDEAHVFAPERGKSESVGSVIDLATRGRKRGYALIAATQRLAKLHKDVAAELLNKLIGRTGLDIDVKRAAEELGLTPRDALAMLRPLEPGSFYAFGPAINTTEPEPLKIGSVQTTHPKVGERHLREPPKPTAAILSVLPKLADLPKEAAQRERTLDDLKKELAQVRRELTLAKRSPDAATSTELRDARATLAQLQRDANAAEKAAARQGEAHRKVVGEALSYIDRAATHLRAQWEAETPQAVVMAPPRPAAPARSPRAVDAPTSSLPVGETAVLSACIQFPDGLQRNQLTVLTGYKRSTRDAYIQRLREKGLVDVSGSAVTATAAGVGALPDVGPLPTGDELQQHWRDRLPEGERRVLDVLIQQYPNDVARDAITDATGYKRSTRDAYLQRLRAKELVTEPSRSMVRATETLFQ